MRVLYSPITIEISLSMNTPSARKATWQHLAEVQGLESQTYGSWPIWAHTIPFPTSLMMGSSGTHLLETYLVVGSAWAQVVGHYLPERAQVLDIGCGCAKVARFLAVDPRVAGYVGFDPIAVCIDWNRRFVAPRARGAFRFEHADLHSAEYNPQGVLAAREYRFPVADGSIDIAIASSLFTHLLEADAVHYLQESARALRPGGKLILSLHNEPPAGQRYAGDEARIDVEIDYFLELSRAADLHLHENLGSLCGQEALVLERR